MFTITITETPQSDNGPLFNNRMEEATEVPPIKTMPQTIEHARVQVATLDVPALLALIYKKPRVRKPRAAK